MYEKNNENGTKNTNATTSINEGAFTELLRNYETATRNRSNDSENEYTTSLKELATACTYSVLKKLCNVGGTVTENTKSVSDSTKVIRKLRTDLARDLNSLDRMNNAVNEATELQYNDNGELVKTVIDKELHNATTALCSQSLSDAMDLVHTAIVAILSETAKVKDLTADFMEIPYTVRRLKSKVYIKEANSVGGYEDTTTTAIQEVYKAIRRDIENSRAAQVASNKYTYLETIVTDRDSDTIDTAYRRLPKYSGLAYEVTDFNGKVTAITADSATVDKIDKLVGNMNLTAKQAKILDLRLSGYGYKAIATYLGITQRAVAKTVEAIRKKAKEIGFNTAE